MILLPGVKTKITTCHRADDETEVGIEYCDSAAEPKDTVACNTQSCDPRYVLDILQKPALSDFYLTSFFLAGKQMLGDLVVLTAVPVEHGVDQWNAVRKSLLT
jgi:hypothetical protein